MLKLLSFFFIINLTPVIFSEQTYENDEVTNIRDFVQERGGVLLNAEKKDDGIYNVEAIYEEPCSTTYCYVNKLLCYSRIKSNRDFMKWILVEGKRDCEPYDKFDDQQPVEEDDFIKTENEHAPVELVHEIQLNDEYVGSGEQFVAIRREPGNSWCADCPTDINPQAEGVQDLVNMALQHLNRHLPTETHTLGSNGILRVQRQAQVVNGVRYILLLEINAKSCKQYLEDKCQTENVNTHICQVTFLEKPWVKLSDGSKFRAVMYNNCTEQYSFGDNGEVLPSQQNTNMKNDLDGNVRSEDNTPGSVSNSDDLILKVHNQEVQALKPQETEQEISPERLKSIEEQIVTVQPQSESEPQTIVNYDNYPNNVYQTEYTVVESYDPLKYHVGTVNENEIRVLQNSPNNMPQNQNQLVTSDNQSNNNNEVQSSTDSKKPSISDEKKHALEGFMSFFDFDPVVSQQNQEIQQVFENNNPIINDDSIITSNNAQENISLEKPRIVNCLNAPESSLVSESKSDSSSSSEESKEQTQVRIRRSVLRFPNKLNEDDNVLRLAKLAMTTMDKFDSDDFKRIVLNVDNYKKDTSRFSTRFIIRLDVAFSNCPESANEYNDNCSLMNDKIKTCVTEIEVGNNGEEKILKTQCYNKKSKQHATSAPNKRMKRHAPKTISNLNDPILVKLASESLSEYETSNSLNYHKIIEIVSATKQIVEGSLTKILFKAAETICSKGVAQSLDECEFSGKPVKLCSASVWNRPWLKDGKQIEVDCETQISINSNHIVTNNNLNLKKRGIPGGVNPISPNDPEVLTFAKESLSSYELNSQLKNYHKIIEIKTATRQVVSGYLIKILFTVKETSCPRSEDKLNEECEFLSDAPLKLCKASIWNQPWLSDGKKIDITCEVDVQPESQEGTRIKRDSYVGGVKKLETNNPEILDLVEESLSKYEMLSSSENHHKVLKINSATRQLVAGTLTKITFSIIETNCQRTDEEVLRNQCEINTEAPVKTCFTKIWNRPWITDGKQVKVDCTIDNNSVDIPSLEANQRLRSKRSQFGSAQIIPIDDLNVINYAKESLSKYELTSSSTKYHKIFQIKSATRKVVAGILTKIIFSIKESSCDKTLEVEIDQCDILSDAQEKLCTASIWDKPWIKNSKIITIDCDVQKKENKRKWLENYSNDQKKFNEFISTFKKPYGNNNKEYQQRFGIFRNNLELIEELNKNEQGTAKYGMSPFADLSQDEFRSKLGLRPDMKNPNDIPLTMAKIPNVTDIPVEFDWRDEGAVTSVKNQGSCGSCWAFSVTGNVEGQWKIKNGNLLSLSEQELVDCDKLDSGCNGGLPVNAYRAIEQLGGLELENDYPYDAADEQCHFNKSLSRVQISGAVNISSNETDMLKWLLKNGPISIGINANAMQFYMGGVSHPFKFLCNPDNLDHGVLIVGYGIHKYPLFHKDMPYWIIKNSWGESWGENGYYRVYRGDGTCGVNQMATSSII